MPITYSRTETEAGWTLELGGELDAMTAPELKTVIDAIASSGKSSVEVNVSQLRLIDSSGVAALVALYKRMKASGGTMVVTGADGQPLQIFKLLRLDRVFLKPAA